MKKLAFLAVGLFMNFIAVAQLERKPAIADRPVELTFHAPRHINLLTIEPLEKKSLHFAIMHTFGTLDGGVQNLFGLDNGANIQLSFEYGFSEKFSLGLSRASQDKVYNLYARHHVLKQTESGSMPVSLSFMGGVGVNTSDYSFLISDIPTFSERTSFAFQTMIARKFSDRFSAQLTPMMAYFVAPQPIFLIQSLQNTHLAIGISGKYRFTGKSSLTLQWIPNLNNSLPNNLGVGIDVEAGGHVFQMYFVTSQALNEQYLLAGGNGAPIDKFRLGFNVNRIFATGKRSY
jgi:hypothetical protein